MSGPNGTRAGLNILRAGRFPGVNEGVQVRAVNQHPAEFPPWPFAFTGL
jgi:hypothetical protein